MVDSDMGFAPDTVERLIASAHKYDRPVVGALCFALRRAASDALHVTRYVTIPTVYEFVERDDEVGFRSNPDYPRDQLVEVAGTGAACMIVHRRALFKVREKYGDEWFTPVTHPTGKTTFSEDLSFCLRLAAAGIPVFVDTSVKTSHYKGGVYLDEGAFLAQFDQGAECLT
jgi:GT2 family glycosyltransferase